ncbi:uncharacterized protein HMPREF1120_07608 [Exophiala dermatitidis NIH/UT8656]|uniref:Uncharacterized protein n=1 Tax=Exophiala dermatitidis (strain ATCC 34100 / CBS 525.76 / NIH/UT8656) TaxID=858893 RepID=H6C7C7_EXODN|nr:uncharacterized protein HMPREF1120_07608 [Exophiala dermatitidis NIH/UT8656]EHY59623.1 hypothetical protein HMPREF1120_07608 [Exophiala dermatitidis NIH/UT8656]
MLVLGSSRSACRHRRVRDMVFPAITPSSGRRSLHMRMCVWIVMDDSDFADPGRPLFNNVINGVIIVMFRLWRQLRWQWGIDLILQVWRHGIIRSSWGRRRKWWWWRRWRWGWCPSTTARTTTPDRRFFDDFNLWLSNANQIEKLCSDC